VLGLQPRLELALGGEREHREVVGGGHVARVRDRRRVYVSKADRDSYSCIPP
jgi:hypothetical protein